MSHSHIKIGDKNQEGECRKNKKEKTMFASVTRFKRVDLYSCLILADSTMGGVFSMDNPVKNLPTLIDIQF